MRRFAKIAKALGNRTPRQVASRLQKYFQKLHAAGLPVPGRIPRNARSYASSRKNRMYKHMARPTTFFPSNYVPVNITEDDDNHAHSLDPNYYRNGCNAGKYNEIEMDNMVVVDEPSDNVPSSNASTKLAEIIKRVMNDKQREYTDETLISEHTGFKVIKLYYNCFCSVLNLMERWKLISFFCFHFQCDYCDEEPITGTRWHCITCENESTDFCSDCFVTQAQEENHHSFDHVFIGYRVSSDLESQSDLESDGDGEQNERTNEDTNDDDSQGDVSCDETMN